MDEIEGLPGELVDRLLNCDAPNETEWRNVAFYASFFLGGKTLHDVIADTGVDPVPGSVGELQRQQHELVSRARYFELIRHRVGELIASGLEEAFLVRSTRDAIRRELEHLADIGTGDRNRAKIRDFLERRAGDPAEVAAFRALLAETDPSAEALTDEQVAAKLRDSASRIPPASPDDALSRWASFSHWDEHAATLLPDAVFDEWHHRTLRRLR
jgi:hypothetical protein